MDRINLCLAHMSGNEMQYIQEAFDTNWVVPLGPNVNAFEEDLEDFVNENGALDKKVVALSAGTAAIHLGLIMLGVGKGDEVICQSFTFAASANPIMYQGATPVFVDSEPSTYNMDPQLLEEAIKDRIAKNGKKPKAIIPVYLYGMPARIDERGLTKSWRLQDVMRFLSWKMLLKVLDPSIRDKSVEHLEIMV